MNKKIQIRNSTAEFLVFTTQTGENTIEVRIEDENVWLSQKLIAVLFEVEVNTINYHIKEILKSREQKDSTIRNFRIVQIEGKRQVEREVEFYNLDMIISVGFRVNSDRAIQFRQWATNVLHNFAIRGYVLDKERLKNGAFFSKKYFDDLLAEIREIRASAKEHFIRKSQIFMQRQWIMIKMQKQQRFFLQQYKINFILQFTDKLLLN